MHPKHQNNQDADNGTQSTKNSSNSNKSDSDNAYDRKTRFYENKMNGHNNANKAIHQKRKYPNQREKLLMIQINRLLMTHIAIRCPMQEHSKQLIGRVITHLTIPITELIKGAILE